MQNYFCLVTILLIPLILIQASGNDLTRISLGYTNGSRLCPSNSCTFQFQGAYISFSIPGVNPNVVVFNGVLRVGIPDSSGGVNYKVYDTSMNLEIIETTERSGTAIHKVTGTVTFGDETIYEIYDGTLVAGGGIVMLDINAQPSDMFVM
jgi:hypothetical protein